MLFDADHTEGTYAAAEALRARFERVVIVTPRDTIATDVQMVTRQGILRRMAEQHIEVVTLAEPRWSEACAEGRIEIVNIYNGDVRVIEDLALLTYATPRVPDDACWRRRCARRGSRSSRLATRELRRKCCSPRRADMRRVKEYRRAHEE